jgi:hypothetical protein
MSEATAKETAERCCEAALAALERGDADKAQRLAEKAMRLAPSDEVRREMKGGGEGKKTETAIDLERQPPPRPSSSSSDRALSSSPLASSPPPIKTHIRI